MSTDLDFTEPNHVTKFLQYALEQVHPMMLEWYSEDDLNKQLLEDVQRDAHEYFSSDFARDFASGAAQVLGIAPECFAHRLLEVAGLRIIAGIRFFGMDLKRPFVEVANISRSVQSDNERDEISAAVAREFTIFKPLHWRVFQASHLPYQFAGCDGDKRVLAGLLSEIGAAAKSNHWERVTLHRARNLEFYPQYEAALQEIYQSRPWLPDVCRIESLEDMRQYLERDMVFEVLIDGEWAGLTIASRSKEFGLRGWYMIEVTLQQRWHGQGLAVAVQRRLAAQLTDEGRDCLFGTIGAVNAPMLKTAERVGRIDLGGQFMVRL